MALGKNDQKIHVVPSKKLVLVRMGNAASNTDLVPVVLDDQIWQKLNFILCDNTATQNIAANDFKINIQNNDAAKEIYITSNAAATLRVVDISGREIVNQKINSSLTIHTSSWTTGVYFINVVSKNKTLTKKIEVN
jgi:hypothetical protein